MGEGLPILLWPEENAEGSSSDFYLLALLKDLVEVMKVQIKYTSFTFFLPQKGVKTAKTPTKLSSTKLVIASE